MPFDTALMFCGHRPGAAWSAIELGGTFAMWFGMTLAMMGPIVLPWAAALARQDGARLGHARPGRLALFLAGYLGVWAGFGLLATLLQWGLATGGILSAARLLDHPTAAGAAFVMVGLYQWSPLKEACLRHCQSPVTFLLTHWREGAWGAAWMGGRHGLHCVGCCWPLMALMLLTGAMSLPWMVGVGGFVLLEMYLPGRRNLSRLAGAILVGLGLLIPLLA